MCFSKYYIFSYICTWSPKINIVFGKQSPVEQCLSYCLLFTHSLEHQLIDNSCV
ncbi:hypothetical protein Hanom_Chr03g00206591 [Helianthus anomalus]